MSPGRREQDLRARRAAFEALNRARLQRAREALGPRRAAWLELLPLLLHVNHPLLPGYVGAGAPAGLPGYDPGREALQLLRRLAPGYRYRRRAYRRFSLQALFLMGSAGSLAQTDDSDLDVWICHDPALGPAARRALAAKCAALEAWGRECFGLETHLYPVDPERFRQGEQASLAADGCGALQHHLLLEEFYRTAIHLAGRQPLWWLVPVEAEREGYEAAARRLVERRFVRPGDWLDLGSPLPLPEGELFDAALWQLYKAIDAPYKSVLKMLLMEAYAAGLPGGTLACHDLKAAVHAGETDPDALDAYALAMARVEAHLRTQGQPGRLELARRCLYFKTQLALSRGAKGWRAALAARLAARWGWDRTRLQLLDARPHWKIERVLEERAEIHALLRDSFRTLAGFAGARLGAAGAAAADLELVARRLKAAMEEAPGKIELINPGISEDLAEPVLSLVHEPGHGAWRLERGGGDGPPRPLRREEAPVALLAWACLNGLVAPHTVLRFEAPATDLTPAEVHGAVRALREALPPERVRRGPAPEALRAPPRLAQALVLVNFGLDPLGRYTRRGEQLATRRPDPLSHGALRQCLVATLDLVARTSWGEVLAQRFEGATAVPDLIAELCAWAPAGGEAAPPPVAVRCFSSVRAADIARRLERLLAHALAAWYGPDGHPEARYVLQTGETYQVLEPEHGVPRPTPAASRAALLEILGLPRPRWSPVVLDRALAEREPVLACALAAARPDAVTVCWRPVGGDEVEVLAVDERGSLVAWHQKWSRADPVIRPLARFLANATARVAMLGGGEAPPVRWHRLEADHEPHLPLRAIARHGPGGLLWSLDCGGRRFDPADHAEAPAAAQETAFLAAARHVLAARAAGEPYPVYLTDVDLPRGALPGPAQTSIYLRWKLRLEARLNARIDAVLQGAA